MILLLVIIFSLICYQLAKKRILFLTSRYRIKPKSLPSYYGMNIAMWNFFGSILAIIFLYILGRLGFEVNQTYTYLAIISIFLIFLVFIFASLKGRFRAQMYFELTLKWLLNIAALISILITISILLSVLFEAIEFFKIIPIEKFILGTKWLPESYDFGVIPVIAGTLLITIIAMLVAVPLGLFSAIYLNEYADKKSRTFIKPILEILSGVPTIVYGYFAALSVGPLIRTIGEAINLSISTESALAAGLVMGIMITPYILSLSDDAINSIPQTLRDAALALGSTKAEMSLKIIIPAASSGIISAMLLAVSRAIGETMIVVMAAGISASLTLNPFDSVSTFTVQIVTLLVGDQEFDNPKTLAAFALALTLFVITLFLNLWALIAMRKKGKYYE
jgi:phosphate transport system permease protein